MIYTELMEGWERAHGHSGHFYRLCRHLLCLEQHRPEGQQEVAHSRLLSFHGNSAKNHTTSNSRKLCPKDAAQIHKTLEVGSPFQIFLSGFLVC